MLHQRLFGFIIFGVVLAPSMSLGENNGNGERSNDILNIVQFLNTTEPIWTYYTTDESTLTCEVDEKINITEKNMYFWRYFYVGQNRSKTQMYGEFEVWENGNRNDMQTNDVYNQMVIGYSSSLMIGSEILLYQSEDKKCGVLKIFRTPTGDWHDLRVKNSSIDQGPSEDCLNFFNAHKKRPERHLYNSTCQGILTPPEENMIPNA